MNATCFFTLVCFLFSLIPGFDNYSNKLPADTIDTSSLLSYYLENGIFPMAVDASGKEDGLIVEPDVYLASTYGGSGWYKSSINSCSVDDITGITPTDLDENDQTIQNAKADANLPGSAIGCGRLALLCQFDYLLNAFNYFELGDAEMGNSYFQNLAATIFANTPGIVGDPFSWLPFVNQGTYVFPSDCINSARYLFELFGMSQRDYYDNLNYQWLSPFDVSGDSIANTQSSSAKLAMIKSSIDAGVPVIWWTDYSGNIPAPYDNHYMNIYGYEKWICSSSGGATTRYLFKICVNWNKNGTIYADESIVLGNHGGFITFTQASNVHLDLDFESVSLPSTLSNTSYSVFNPNQQVAEIYTNRLSYQNVVFYPHFNYRKVLLMSGRNGNYHQSYFGMVHNQQIANLTFYLSRWPSDSFDSNDSLYLSVYGTGYSNSHDIPLSSLSADYENPTKITFSFIPKDFAITEFCLQLYSPSSNNNIDDKRICLSGLSVIYERSV